MVEEPLVACNRLLAASDQLPVASCQSLMAVVFYNTLHIAIQTGIAIMQAA